MTPDCFPAHQTPSEKGSTLKVRNLLPLGAFCFLFSVDPFSEGRQTVLIEFPPLNMFLFLLK